MNFDSDSDDSDLENLIHPSTLDFYISEKTKLEENKKLQLNKNNEPDIISKGAEVIHLKKKITRNKQT